MKKFICIIRGHLWSAWTYHREQGETWQERTCKRCGQIEQWD